ncbi:MAG: C10 family peptidase [Tidjanibacter sp.]|nr:C10 family peptidase [Tidjanibacter sp.]
MKRLQHLLLLLFTIVGVVACSYNELPEELSKMASPIETPIVLNVETRAETYDGEALDQNYFVSEADLENYVRYRRSATKQPNLTVKEVKSYGFDSSQTLFYILNYEKGWEVVSADKRVQPTLAYGDEGAFTMDCDNEPMKFWMNMLASGVLQTRQRTGDSAVATATTASKEESDKADDEEQNVAFWNAISPTQQQNSRGEILIPTPGPLEPIDTTLMPLRKYYLPHLQESFTNNIYYGPYIQTSWGQGSPWNMYCPKYNNLSNSPNAAVGCGAVAAGQMLYYLRNKLNLTIVSYESIQCEGDTLNYTMTRNGPSTELWSNMAKSVADSDEIRRQYTAALLADVGDVIKTDYGKSSSSNFTNTRNYLFLPLGINCNHEVYNETSMVSQLTNRQMPVMVRGTSDTGGHAWIVDGYNISNYTIRKYYIITRLLMDQTSLLSITKENATGYEDSYYTNSANNLVHMNWGWNGSSDGWYASVYSAPTSSSNGPYDSNVNILYDFSKVD